MSNQMVWYRVTAESAGQRDLDLLERYKGTADPDFVAGGLGWKVERDDTANPHQSRTLRDCVLIFKSDKGSGLYLSYGVLNTLGVNTHGMSYRGSRALPGLRIGTATFFKFTADLSAEIEERIGYERRSDRERFVQDRNAGIWNALLVLVNEWRLEIGHVTAFSTA